MTALGNSKYYICEQCGVKSDDVYWKEFDDDDGTKTDMFVCVECYFKAVKDKKEK